MSDCERRAPLCQDGLSLAELETLTREGQPNRGITMDEKWMGVWRHLMNTVGALLLMYGMMDEATWLTVSGAITTLVPYVWSWVSKV